MAKDKNIIVLEDFNFDTPKTKSYTELLSLITGVVAAK